MSTWQYDSFQAFRKQQNKIATQYFTNKGFQVQPKKTYSLSGRTEWSKNIILESVYQYIDVKKSEAKDNKDAYHLHKDLHHGLSSQAMLFNLFGDAVVKKDYKFFQEVFQSTGIQIDSKYELKFEHCDRKTFIEKTQQPTSFDFAVYDKTGIHKNIFVEAKYVETEFGGCSAIKGGECDGLNPIC